MSSDKAFVGFSNFKDQSRERLLSPQREHCDDLVGGQLGTEQGGWERCIIAKAWDGVSTFFRCAWEFAKGDPRRVIFSVKMGITLSLVSLLMFTKLPYKEITTYSVWAIMTVVVVFEFTVGATLSKGFNRGLGTISAGGLALGVAELAICTGRWEPVMIIVGIFTAGSVATFVKFYPKMKPYEYGFRVFLITFCYIMVSGYRTREFIQTAVTRFILIAFGAGISLVINAVIYPIWAGEDLHRLIVKNFKAVAGSLEGCIDGYLKGVELQRVSSKIFTCQASDDPLYGGYRSAIISATQEETLEGFASWEPPHGRYRMLKYPWKQYVKVGGALRHCAYMVMALHGCLLSEIQASHDLRQVFSSELRRVSSEGGNVLRELASHIDNMTKLKPGDVLHEVHKAAEELQRKIDAHSYLLVNSESWVFGKEQVVPSSESNIPMEDEDRDQLGNLERSEDGHQFGKEQVVNACSKSWDSQCSYLSPRSWPADNSVESKLCRQLSWPSRHIVDIDYANINRELKVLESASAFSLATFASLLIEFVARLDSLLNTFKELSVRANFKEPNDPASSEANGIFQKFLKLLRLQIGSARLQTSA